MAEENKMLYNYLMSIIKYYPKERFMVQDSFLDICILLYVLVLVTAKLK